MFCTLIRSESATGRDLLADYVSLPINIALTPNSGILMEMSIDALPPKRKRKKMWASYHFLGYFSLKVIASPLFFDWPFDHDADMLQQNVQ